MLKDREKEKNIVEQKKDKMRYIFKPFISVGDYKLGVNVKDFLKKKDYWIYYPPYKDLNGEDYKDEIDGITLGVENEKIISITCSKECIYKGENLIGMPINKFMKKFNLQPDEIDKLWVSDDEQEDVYNFDDLGIMVWVDKNGIIRLVDAFGREEK